MTSEINIDAKLIGTPFQYADLVGYQDGAIVSRTIIDKPVGTVTVFAFDASQKLSTHSAPYDALVQVIDGTITITIEESVHVLEAPAAIIMPANKPHAVDAVVRGKMVLIMIRSA